ncbi:MAG: hypothetical protein ABSA17_04465, partial [Rhabdochlamydiaceae bacterium]
MQNINHFITKSINSNNQCDKVIQSIAELNSQRVISILLPFLSLHSKIASAASHIARAYQLGSIWMGEASSRPTYDKSIDTLKLAGSVATSILFPSGQLLYSSIVFFIEQAQKFSEGGNWDKAESLYQISSQIVHLASIYYGTPKWIVISLLSQGAGELNKARNEKKTPEAIANVLLAAIRGYKAVYIYNDFSLARAKPVQPEPVSPEEYGFSDDDYEFSEDKIDFVDSNPPAESLPEIKSDEPDFIEEYGFSDDDYEFPEDELCFVDSNPPAEPLPETAAPAESSTGIKNLTTSDWKVIYQKYFDAPQQEMPAKVHLETLLRCEGFSNTLNDIDFTQTGPLKNIYFENLHCTNCNFSGVKISNADFKNF